MHISILVAGTQSTYWVSHIILDCVCRDGTYLGLFLFRDGTYLGLFLFRDGTYLGLFLFRDGTYLGLFLLRDGSHLGLFLFRDGSYLGLFLLSFDGRLKGYQTNTVNFQHFLTVTPVKFVYPIANRTLLKYVKVESFVRNNYYNEVQACLY